MSSLLFNNHNQITNQFNTILNLENKQIINSNSKMKIAIDNVCFQLQNNNDICYIWEQFLHNLPHNKDNFNYEIILLQRTKPNSPNINSSSNSIYQFKKQLNLETKFKIKQIPDFNYMSMNQDVDILNNICRINKYDVFISSSFTYCNSIPNVVIVYDMIPEMNKIPNNHFLIQKNKAILNASSFITFSKKTYDKLLEFYPHITNNNTNNNTKNHFPLDILKHTIENNTTPNLEKDNYSNNTNNQLQSLNTYLTSLKNTILKPKPFINIILQSYPETNLERLKELKYCLRKNLENPYVRMVYDFGSGIDLFISSDGNSNSNGDDIILIEKYKVIKNTKWLTFDMAITFANLETNINNGEYWCIMNLDIFLDDKSPWNTIRGQLNNGFIYAQSRHEFNIIEDINTNTTKEDKIVAQMDANFAQMFHANTQDAWLFKTPFNNKSDSNKNIDFDFELGFLGCDNAIADRFIKAGYKVINQPMTYKIFHYDIAKGKNSSNFLSKHIKETKEMTDKMIKPKNKYPERRGSYLVPNYDQMVTMNTRNEIDLGQLINSLGGCSNFERYEFISRLFSDRILITNP